MKKKHIVLVVGAGASHDFEPQMGLGKDLVEGICNRVYERDKPEPYLSTVISSIANDEKAKEFRDNLQMFLNRTKSYSIDAFLNEFPTEDYQEIGRFMIAAHVLGYEQECLKSAAFEKKETWLEELTKFIDRHNLLVVDNSEIELNILTFNYDRLIEEYLFRKYGAQAENYANNHITHVYGKISNLPWQNKKLEKIVRENIENVKRGKGDKMKDLPFIHFGHPNYDFSGIQRRKENILLMYQDRGNPEAKLIIEKGSVVLFVGFAYDTQNMEVLGINSKMKKEWHSNHYNGFGEESKTILSNYFNSLNHQHHLTCKDFIKRVLNA